MNNQLPPHDLGLEAAVIAAVFMDGGVLPRITASLRAEDFYATRHRRIWESMLVLAGQGLPIDAVTVGNHLRAADQLAPIGGAAALAEVIGSTSTTVNAEDYARIIRRHANSRRVIDAAHRILAAGYGQINDHETFANDARAAIAEACADTGDETSTPQRLDADFSRLLGDLERGTEPEGIVKTGIEPFDRAVGGLWPGLVHIIAARPSMGKSAFGLNVGTNAALAGRRVLLFSMEDVRYFLAIRQLGRFADIDTQLLTMRRVPMDSFRNVIAGINAASGLPLWVDDSGSLSVSQIRSKALRHRDQHGLDLLVIDHLAEIDEAGDGETQIVSRAMRGVRDLTKELGVPTLLLHQLNRKVEERASKIPMLQDLKNSGKVEEASRLVAFLYRPGYYDGNEDRRDIQMHVAKANHGRIGLVKLWGDLSRMFIRGWDVSRDGAFPVDVAPVESSDKKWTRVDGIKGGARHHTEDY